MVENKNTRIVSEINRQQKLGHAKITSIKRTFTIVYFKNNFISMQQTIWDSF